MERTHKLVVKFSSTKVIGLYYVNVNSKLGDTSIKVPICLNHPKKHYEYIIESPLYNKQGFLGPKHKQIFIMLHDIGWNIMAGLDPNLYQ